ncbi:MAG: VWA domain-containing protein [Vicinamibacterales bacterium]
MAPVLMALAVTTVVLPSPASAQREERSIYASVLDQSGAPVKALAASDFIVRENGVQREILEVKRATDPLQIAVLVDTSEAITPHLNDLRIALRSFFRKVPGTHEIALYEFGERPALLADYSRDLARHEAAVGRLFARSGSGAYLLDAIVEATRGLRRREGLRPVIVVITAEGPEFSDRYHRTVLDDLRLAGATLHSFVFDEPATPLFDDAAWEREFTLAKGARNTGGRRENLLTSMALAGRLRDLAAELRNQYQVVYARPESLIPPDTVEVSIKPSGLTVRAAQAWTSEGWRSQGR